uniref:Uncharacterized protein n=2 Tax=Meloidogyne TaxID=189290 RepID=A0A6V7TNV3_MELEN|nr:unnamed protein product [Meloidogyne enterolobii]
MKKSPITKMAENDTKLTDTTILFFSTGSGIPSPPPLLTPSINGVFVDEEERKRKKGVRVSCQHSNSSPSFNPH